MPKGKPITDKHRENLRLSHLGQEPWNKNKRTGIVTSGCFKKGWAFWKGKHRSQETKDKISKKLLHNIPWNKGKTGVYSKETIKKMKEKLINMTKEEKIIFLEPWIQAGHKAIRTLEVRQKMSEMMRKKLAKMTRQEILEYTEAGRKAAQEANPSSIEKMIWKVLDKLGFSYKIQVSFNKHRFVADIYIPAQRLIIECNGDYWHNYKIFPEKEKRDKAFKEYAKDNNYRLVELWESEIRKNPRSTLLKSLKL